MTIIINPNNPQLPRSHIDTIFDTMRVIAAYRQSFFDLEAAKQNNGAQEPLTATELDRLCEAQQHLMQDMIDFILYGAGNGNPNTNGQTSNTNIENNTQEIQAQPEV